ncbi:hypothetical protein DSO57_1030139 [Entomophthora muscae]|uniref:Uncharacterized protein n=1 Tax=Entomophthora muscae TaxID=34485 RepID=A0ACC2S343_9FUNG|nr:hypothetical protein DSO57_1030139 [Entomophthora muscae]
MQAGFEPLIAQAWKNTGFSAGMAQKWITEGVNLEWAEMFKHHKVKKWTIAEDWCKTNMNFKEIEHALKHCIPIAEAVEWLANDFNIFQAVEYFQAHIGSSLACKLKGIPLRAEEIMEYFSTLRDQNWAIGWAKIGIPPKEAKVWGDMRFGLEEA